MAEPESVTDEHVQRRRAGIVSLVFWCCLFTSAACYAAVALSPRILRHLDLRREHDRNQVKLVTLERQVEYLEKVSAALEHDPQFAEELARIELDASRTGDERIPVDRSLSLDGNVDRAQELQFDETLPWYLPFVQTLSEHRRVRISLLVLASTLTITAFVFLQEPSGEPIRKQKREKRSRTGILGALAARYAKPAEDEENDDVEAEDEEDAEE